MREALASDVAVVVPHVLHGLGGVGKTRVAIEYVYRFCPEYNLVWWISADQPVRVRSSLAALAPHLELRFPGIGIKDAATVVLETLRRGKPYGRWLLIFDNADESEDISNSNPYGPGTC